MKTQDENAKLKYYTASQWQLIWWRFRKHRLSIIGMTILGIFIIFALFPEFFAPYSATERNGESVLCPPSKIVFKNAEGKFSIVPKVYGFKKERNKETLKMDYVNVPILANFHVAQGLAVKVGIQPGFLINDKVEVSANGFSAEVELKESYRALGVDADIPSVDFAIPLGVSYEYSHVVLDARYNFSLTNAISVLGESTKHSVFQITLGYKFSL